MKNRVKQSLILLIVGVVINVLLSATKLYVGLSSNSITIMLDATNSLFDVITCIITIIAFCILLAPRSKSTPFGYGRSEYLAGFVVAVVAVVVGGMFFIRSLNRLAMPEPIYFGWQNCVLISVAVPVKLGVGLFYYFSNRKIKSKALKAIMLDSFLDTGITLTSLISFAISSKVDYAVDAIIGIIMSVVVVIFAIKMVWDNIKCIVIGDGAEEEREAIKDVCEREGLNIKNIIVHDYGYGAKYAKVEIEDNDLLQNEQKQGIINRVESDILTQCGAHVDVIVSKDTSFDDTQDKE